MHHQSGGPMLVPRHCGLAGGLRRRPIPESALSAAAAPDRSSVPHHSLIILLPSLLHQATSPHRVAQHDGGGEESTRQPEVFDPAVSQLKKRRTRRRATRGAAWASPPG